MASSEIAEAYADKSVDKVALHKGRIVNPNTGDVLINKDGEYYIKKFGEKAEYIGKHLVPADYDFSNEPTQSPALPAPPPVPAIAPPPSKSSSGGSYFYGGLAALGSAFTAAVTYDLPGMAYDALDEIGNELFNQQLQSLPYAAQYASDLQYDTFADFLAQASRLLTDEFGPYVADIVVQNLNPANTYTIADLAALGHEALRVLRAAGLSSRGRPIRHQELPRWR